jgi:hypothetical protein
LINFVANVVNICDKIKLAALLDCFSFGFSTARGETPKALANYGMVIKRLECLRLGIFPELFKFHAE